MGRVTEEFDGQWDVLMRQAGPLLDLPADPGSAQRQAWKSPRRRWVPRRMLSLWTGSGAVAAAIVIGLLMFMAPRQVGANLIFDNLRDALGRSMKLSFENVEVDLDRLSPWLHGHLSVSGEVLASDEDGKQAYADMRVKLSAAARQQLVPPMELDVRTSAVPGSEWAYLQLLSMSQTDSTIDPRLGVAGVFMQRGVYLDLAGLMETKTGRRAVSMPAFGLGAIFKLRDRDGLTTLIYMIEQYARTKTVEDLGDGQYVLKAAGFRRPDTDNAVATAVSGLLANMSLEVTYDQAIGVSRLKIEHFGHGEGLVVLDLGDVHIPDGQFDLDRHRAERPGVTLDLQTVRRLNQWVRHTFKKD